MEDSDRELSRAVEKIGSGPLLVNVIAKRVRQLQRGSKVLLDDPTGFSIEEIAIRELLEEKIGYRERK